MTKTISFINLKGGVGKTTAAVNAAAVLARNHNKRVLVIDLDPQTNATICLISQQDWQKQHLAGQTLFHLFRDKLTGGSTFNINSAILQNVGGVNNLNLLPSSLELVEIQDDIPDMDTKAFVSHVDVVGNEIASVKDNYDYIVIDCPPNLGAITLNGISISDYYVVPMIPDILSKIGISLIRNRVNRFKALKRTCDIELAGIVFTKIDYRTNLHNSTMTEIRTDPAWAGAVFTAEIPQRISISEAPTDSMPFITSSTAKKKGDWADTLAFFTKFTNELVTRTP
jgi:chromosome partitioning protein